MYTFPERLDLRNLMQPNLKIYQKHTSSPCISRTDAPSQLSARDPVQLPIIFSLDSSPLQSPLKLPIPSDSNFPSPVHRQTESQPISPVKMPLSRRQSMGNSIHLPRLDVTPTKITPRTKLEIRHPSIRRIRTVNVRALDKDAFKVIHTHGDLHDNSLIKDNDSNQKPISVVVESKLNSEPTSYFNPKFVAHKKNKISVDFSFNKEPSECNDVSTQDKSSPDKASGSIHGSIQDVHVLHNLTPVKEKEKENFVFNNAGIFLNSTEKKIRSKRKILVNNRIQNKFC